MSTDRVVISVALAMTVGATLGLNAPARAAEIYKSIGQDGKVTYSATPLKNAVSTETIEPPRQPTQEEVWAAQDAHELIKAIGDEMEQDRKQREKEQAQAEADERANQNANASAPSTIVYVPMPIVLQAPSPSPNRSPSPHKKPMSR